MHAGLAIPMIKVREDIMITIKMLSNTAFRKSNAGECEEQQRPMRHVDDVTPGTCPSVFCVVGQVANLNPIITAVRLGFCPIPSFIRKLRRVCLPL